MGGSNRRAPSVLAIAVSLMLSAAVAACGSPPPASVAPPSAAPSVAVITDPHLSEPATADQIFTAIRTADLPLAVTNATAGGPSSPMIKQINAQVANWPLIITQYRSGAALRDALKWDPSRGPNPGDPPYAWVAMNILIAFGPSTAKPTAPDATRQEQAKALVALIEPLLWPIEQRSIAPVPTRTAPPAAAVASPAP